MIASPRRFRSLLSLLALSALAACTAAPSRPEARGMPQERTVPIPPLPVPPAPRPAPPEPGEQGLRFRLREGEAPAAQPRGERLGPDPQALSTAATAALLARLPALPAEDTAGTRFPVGSPPPPRAGAVIAASFPPPDTLSRPRAEPADEAPLTVLRVVPEGETGLAPHLTIVFSRPMVPLTRIGALQAGEPPVRLTPRPSGNWSWIDTRTLRFEPRERFPMATRFRVEIPAGTRSATGAALARDVHVEFATPAPGAVGGYPHLAWDPPPPSGYPPPPPRFGGDARGEATGLQPVVLLVFDQRVAPAAVLRTTRLLAGAQPRAARLATPEEIAADSIVRRLVEAADPERWVALRPVEPLPTATLVRVLVGSGTPSAEGPRTTEVTQELRFRTYGPLEVTYHGCGGEPPVVGCRPGMPWRIRFSNPLDPDAWSDTLLRVEPAVPDLAVDVAGHELLLSGDFRPRTTYRVTLSAAIRDRFGQRLGEPRTLTLEVDDLEPTISLPGAPLMVLDPEGPPRVMLHSRGHVELRVRVHRVLPEQWSDFAEAVQRYHERGGATPLAFPGEAVVDSVFRPGGGEEGLSITPIDLSRALRDGLGHAAVVVDEVERAQPAPAPPDPRVGRAPRLRRQPTFAWVQATRIGLHAMADRDEMLGWATSLRTGEPLRGVELRLHPSGTRATTGAEGVAVLPLAIGPAGAGRSAGAPGADYLLIARQGDDVALLPEHPYAGARGGSWVRQETAGELRWMLVTDRGLYRPGETVHLKGWLRQADAFGEDDLALPRGVDRVAFTATGPQQEEIGKGEMRPGPLGGFHTAIELPDALNLGHVQIRLEAGGQAVPEAGRESWHSAMVQEFRRPEYEVGVQADPGPHLVGGSIEASARASYYSGGGLPDARVIWQVHSRPGHFAPPGWERWHFGRAPGWGPWMTPGGLGHQSLSGVTDASGTHHLRIDLLDVEPPFPASLRAEAQVEDVSRQVGSGGVDLLVHPAALYAGVRMERRWMDPGDSAMVELVVVDLAGAPAPGHVVELYAERMDWRREGGWQAVDTAAVCRVASGAEPVSCAWTAARGGSYRLRAEVRDEAGRLSRTELPVWVAGGPIVARPERPDAGGVELVPDRSEYQPGDTAVVLVQAPFSPAGGMLTLRRMGVVRRESFRMEGTTHRLRVPITEEHLSGVWLRVDLVDLSSGTGTASGDLRLSVPPRRRELRVSVTPRDSVLAPGAQTSVEVEVRDAAGRPAAGAEIAVWMVDEAVLALGGYRLPDPLERFYPERFPSVRDYQLRPWVVLAPRSQGPGTVAGVLLSRMTGEPLVNFPVALEGTGHRTTTGADGSFVLRGVPPGEHVLVAQRYGPASLRQPVQVPAGGIHLGTLLLNEVNWGELRARSGDELAVGAVTSTAAPPPAPMMPKDAVELQGLVVTGQAAPVAVRTDFAPLAFFEPALRTGADGKVRVPVRLPGSLTRYRVMAVAVQGAKLFGRGEAALTARHQLMVRPSPPRFLNYGDRAEIPVLLQNLTDRALQVDVAVRGSGLRLEDARGRRVVVPARDRVELRFPASAHRAGTAYLQAVAAAGGLADAAAVAFPVYTPATAEAFATYGELDRSVPLVLPVQVPDSVLESFGGLEVTVSSTALQELTDAVLYLRSYPFEGAEQVASRVLAVAALRDVLAAFAAEELPAPEEIVDSTRRDIQRLVGLQHHDGGWGFWRQDEPSDPFVSVHVAHALQRARENGFAVPEHALTRAVEYLRGVQQHIPATWSPRARTALTAYSLYVRDRMNDADATAQARRLAEDLAAIRFPGDVPLDAAGWLLHALADAPQAAAERAELLRLVRNRATETAATATFAASYQEEEQALLLHSARRSDAVLLEALIAAEPGSDLIPRVTRGLLAHRVRGRWRSTQENAWVLLALERYFRTYEAATPSFRSRVWLGERFAGGHAFQGRTTERHHVEVPMRHLVAADTAADLTLQREGEGRMYFRAGLRYAPADLSLDPLERGFVVERVYEAVDDPADVRRDADGTWRIRAGSRVRVRLGLTAPARRYHVALVDPLPAGLEPLNPELRGVGFTDAPPPPPPGPRPVRRPEPPRWSPAWFAHQNLRDDRAEAFATLLPAGAHEFAYLARATTLGEFVVPPPRAEEMYAPETFGRGASARVVVE